MMGIQREKTDRKTDQSFFVAIRSIRIDPPKLMIIIIEFYNLIATAIATIVWYAYCQ